MPAVARYQINLGFQECIRKVEVVFRPDEIGRDRALEDLNDGQRSLFHLAMTAATVCFKNGLGRSAIAVNTTVSDRCQHPERIGRDRDAEGRANSKLWV